MFEKPTSVRREDWRHSDVATALCGSPSGLEGKVTNCAERSLNSGRVFAHNLRQQEFMLFFPAFLRWLSHAGVRLSVYRVTARRGRLTCLSTSFGRTEYPS